ncbi:MAG: DUF2303 family protein [Rhodospirillaceae bacterium]
MKDQDTNAVIQTVKDLHQPQLLPVKHGEVETAVLVLPNGLTAKPVTEITDKLLPAPRRKTGTIVATTHASFNDIVAAHKEDSSVVFVDGETGAFTAVLNFHGTKADGQRFGDLRVTYAPTKSKAWNAWQELSEEFVNVSDFANHIDANILDVTEPPPHDSALESDIRMRDLAKAFSTTFADKAKIIEISRGLRIHTKDQIENVLNTSTGETSIEFKSEHEGRDGQKLTVPGLFCIAIPVFEKGVVYRLPVRFKYRAGNGSLAYSYTVLNDDKAIEHAVNEMVMLTKEATALPVFYGKAP